MYIQTFIWYIACIVLIKLTFCKWIDYLQVNWNLCLEKSHASANGRDRERRREREISRAVEMARELKERTAQSFMQLQFNIWWCHHLLSNKFFSLWFHLKEFSFLYVHLFKQKKTVYMYSVKAAPKVYNAKICILYTLFALWLLSLQIVVDFNRSTLITRINICIFCVFIYVFVHVYVAQCKTKTKLKIEEEF